MKATIVDGRGWSGADGGEVLPIQVSVAGPMPGTETLLLALTPETGDPVCVLLDHELALRLAAGLTARVVEGAPVIA
jgi:hypothetical protein